jgi:hypothetical protein
VWVFLWCGIMVWERIRVRVRVRIGVVGRE